LEGFHSIPGYLPPDKITTGGYNLPVFVAPRITVNFDFSFFPPP